MAVAWAALAAGELEQPQELAAHYAGLLQRIGLGGAAGYSGYNLLMTPDWMMLVRRGRSAHEGLGVNALGFAGTLLVRGEEELQRLRAMGPLTLLRAVSG